MSNTNGDREKKVRKLLEEYGQMSANLKALKETSGVEYLEECVKKVKTEVEELTKSVGVTIQTDGWQAVLTSEKQYGTWDDDKLVSFAGGIADDGLRTRLLALREVKTRSASVAIRARK